MLDEKVANGLRGGLTGLGGGTRVDEEGRLVEGARVLEDGHALLGGGLHLLGGPGGLAGEEDHHDTDAALLQRPLPLQDLVNHDAIAVAPVPVERVKVEEGEDQARLLRKVFVEPVGLEDAGHLLLVMVRSGEGDAGLRV